MSALRKAVPPVDVFITHELLLRAPKKADYLQEKLALQDLARQMVEHPAGVLPHLVDLAIEICDGISGGISLYEPDPAPGVFRWHYLRGSLEKFSGGTTPRDFSPCGVTLDLKTPVLSAHPERVYLWLADAGIAVPEVLLVPLYVGGATPLGTLWIVSANEGHFDSGHARIMTELAAFAGMALRMAQTEERLQLASVKQAQLMTEQETLTKEMGHRVKNLFAIVGGMVRVSARAAATPNEMADILSGRLLALAAAHAVVRRTFDEKVSRQSVRQTRRYHSDDPSSAPSRGYLWRGQIQNRRTAGPVGRPYHQRFGARPARTRNQRGEVWLAEG